MKSILNGRTNIKAEALKLDYEGIYNLFEQNITKGDKLVAIIASGLLADMMQINQQISSFVT